MRTRKYWVSHCLRFFNLWNIKFVQKKFPEQFRVNPGLSGVNIGFSGVNLGLSGVNTGLSGVNIGLSGVNTGLFEVNTDFLG